MFNLILMSVIVGIIGEILLVGILINVDDVVF